jgi:hypothetical protein
MGIVKESMIPSPSKNAEERAKPNPRHFWKAVLFRHSFPATPHSFEVTVAWARAIRAIAMCARCRKKRIAKGKNNSKEKVVVRSVRISDSDSGGIQSYFFSSCC